MNKFTSVVVYSGKNELYRFETSPEKWTGGALREVDDSEYISKNKITCVTALTDDVAETDLFAEDGSVRKVKISCGRKICRLEFMSSNTPYYDLLTAAFDFEEKYASVEYLLPPESTVSEIAVVAHTADGRHLCVHKFAPAVCGVMTGEDFSVEKLRRIKCHYRLSVVVKNGSGKIVSELK